MLISEVIGSLSVIFSLIAVLIQPQHFSADLRPGSTMGVVGRSGLIRAPTMVSVDLSVHCAHSRSGSQWTRQGGGDIDGAAAAWRW